VSRWRRRWSQRSLVCESNIVLTTFPLVDKQIVTHFFSFLFAYVRFIGRVCVGAYVGVDECACVFPCCVFVLFRRGLFLFYFYFRTDLLLLIGARETFKVNSRRFMHRIARGHYLPRCRRRLADRSPRE